jgi:hypothetical protein
MGPDMKNPRWILLLLLAPLLWLSACDGDRDPCEEGVYTTTCKPPREYYDNRITEAKRYLGLFDGKRARDVFKQVNEDHIKFNNKPYCTAAYGVVLADLQVFVENLNGLALRLLTNMSAGGGAAPAYLTAAQANDFGVLIENGWSSFEPVLTEMSEYARTVTALPDCSFSIGLGGRDEKVSDTQVENPYQYVINIGGPGGTFSPLDFADETKIKNAPVAQIILKARFDAAEARLIDMIASSLLGGAHFVLAHDYSLTLNLYKIATQLGLPLECVRTDVFDCSFEEGINADQIINNILGWSFLFEENPNLLAKSAARWDRRMPYVDNEFKGALYTMRTFFNSLVARNETLRTQTVSAQQLDEFVFLYRDNNENSVVDAFDDLGINFTEIKLSPEFIIAHTNLEATPEGEKRADEMRKSFRTIESAINGAKSILKGFRPSEGAVAEVQTFIERGYSNFAAVDNPSVPHERIPISSFNTVIQDFLFSLIDAPLPNFMEFDLTTYFTEPRPLREFLPYWQIKDGSQTGSEFLVDSDMYESYKEPVTASTPATGVTAPQWIRALEWDTDFAKLVDEGERAVFPGTYDGGVNGTLSGLTVPSDCINGTNMTSMVPQAEGPSQPQPWPVFYLALPDPTLNNMVWVDLDAWTPYYDGAGNGLGCVNDPLGIQPASNYAITKGMWMFLDFIVDHFQLTALLGMF